ncbi:MAG: SDR family oxidoreductase [Proteobacteria bacterium]|nr:SDR family oxidoreductase [Pseudomonadota bacterium]
MTGTGRLEGKVAVITGAASGIGQAASIMFAREGARVVLADVVEDEMRRIVDEIESKGGTAVMKRTDVSDEDQVRALIELALKNFSRLDILCNNAGVTGGLNEIENEDADNWRRVLDVNLMGAVYGVKHVSGPMKSIGAGSIVNTASVAGIRAGAGSNAYSASKAALINFTRTAACDLGAFNVRVNAVCPGLIETGMTKPVFDYARETGKIGKVGNRCELRRYGRPHEIAGAMLFLASDEASFITGQALAVDGGNTCSLNLPGMKF